MYLTAHRVQRGAAEGVNAFVHVHGSTFPWPADASTMPDTEPGQEVEAVRQVELRPGGNRVKSYLDVLAPDGTPWLSVAAALDALDHDLEQRLNPMVFSQGEVTLRFGVEFGLTGERPAELGRLRRYIQERWEAWEAYNSTAVGETRA